MIDIINWNTLTPDERDRVVAEKVMGWQAKPCDGEMGELPTSSDGWFCQSCGYSGDWGDGFEHEEVPDRYTRSLDIAWKIVEHFKNSNGWIVFCENIAQIATSKEITSVLWYLSAEVICVAALRTCDFEVVL